MGLWAVLAPIDWPDPRPPPWEAGIGVITVRAVVLDEADPVRRSVGALRFLAGWSLASDDVRFGGISAIHVEDGRVIALSDVGMVMRFALPAAAGAIPFRIDPLLEGPGPRTRKSNRDTEAMLIRGGEMWAAFERHNMIWRYDAATLRARSAARPGAMRRWGGNRGPEALVGLADGRFLAFSEGRDDSAPYSEAVLFFGDPADPATRAAPVRYRRIPGYRPTDAALLPDGRILILNRRFRLWEGISARLIVVDPAGLAPGGAIEGREIAALQSPLTVDNMEALALTVEAGRTIVWIASDDNFSPLQRTLLLKFELRE